MRETFAAVILAAGQGKRMGTDVPKQYLEIGGKPVLAYSLQAFQVCPCLDEIVLVTGREDLTRVKEEIVGRYGLTKVKHIVPGGAERFLSVYEGLKAVGGCDYVLIHDGARPFIDQELLARVLSDVKTYGACAAGMPSKDTVKISDEKGFAEVTPDRSHVWNVQTPQAFSYPMIFDAYRRLIESGRSDVTDDAMVLERMTQKKVRLTEGSYRNIKITTPDDLEIAEVFAKHIGWKE